jgi:predicted phosphodiesterase
VEFYSFLSQESKKKERKQKEMATWGDLAMEQFYYLRLGNALKKPNHYNYTTLNYEKRRGTITYCPSPDQTRNQKLPLSEYSTEQLPSKPVLLAPTSRALRIIVISDTHDRHHLFTTLPECDILIHGGDILMTSRKLSAAWSLEKFRKFNDWISKQPAKHKFVIGGNHDKELENLTKQELNSIFTDCQYLCNEFIEVEGLIIFATPLSNGDSGNQAFQSKEFNHETRNLLSQQEIGRNMDILITHGTCSSLRHQFPPNLMHISAHAHCYYGVHLYDCCDEERKVVNVSGPIMDHKYNPTRLPLIVDCIIQEA